MSKINNSRAASRSQESNRAFSRNHGAANDSNRASAARNRINNLRASINSRGNTNSTEPAITAGPNDQIRLDPREMDGSFNDSGLIRLDPREMDGSFNEKNKDLKQTQTEGIKNSDFKIDYYKARAKNLDGELKADQSVDHTLIKLMKGQFGALESFFKAERNFWEDESKVKYKDKDLEQVQSIYGKINEAEKDYEKAVINKNGVSDINKDLKGLKSDLAKMRGYQTNQPSYKDPKALEEAVFSEFKTEYYAAQKKELIKVRQEFASTLTGPGTTPDSIKMAKAEMKKITEEIKVVDNAKTFWEKEASFWNKLGNAGQSERGQDKIDGLTAKLTRLENEMDQFVTVSTNPTSPEGKAVNLKIQSLNQQIASTKSSILNLHTHV